MTIIVLIKKTSEFVISKRVVEAVSDFVSDRHLLLAALAPLALSIYNICLWSVFGVDFKGL